MLSGLVFNPMRIGGRRAVGDERANVRPHLTCERERSMNEYLGLSTDAWKLLFAGLQAASVSFAVVFGAYQLRSIRRQRAALSLERMFAEWRTNLPAHRHIQTEMPLHEGSVEERAFALACEVQQLRASGDENAWSRLHRTLEIARETVHSLNDVGVFVERGVVDQRDFFNHFHPRVVELAYLLEPYTLLVSTARGARWGLRLRRLRIGAERYHRAARIHAHLDLTARGQVILAGRHSPRRTRLGEVALRRRLIPKRHETSEEEDRMMERLRSMLESTGDPALAPGELRRVLNV